MPKKTQLKLFQEVIDLKNANPELEIKICVDSSELSDDYGWMLQKITKVEISDWIETDDIIKTDNDDILEYLIEQVYDEYPDFCDERIDALASMRYAEQVKKAICVFTSF